MNNNKQGLLEREDSLYQEMEAIKAKSNLTDQDRFRFDKLMVEFEDCDREVRLFDIGSRPVGKPIIDLDDGTRSFSRASGPFKRFGEFLQSVVRAGSPGQKTDQKLFDIQTRGATGLGETIPADSGFLVQTDFSNKLITQVDQTSQLKPLCFPFLISGVSNKIQINAFDETSRVTGNRWGGIRVYWLSEAAEKLATKPKFRQMELSLKKLVGLCYITDEALADAAELERIVTQAFTSELSYECDDVILNGSGVGRPLGVLSSNALITVVRNTPGQVVYDDIISMWSRLMPGSHRNSYWLINSNVLPQLMKLSISVGTAGGGLIYQPAGQASASPYQTLMGRPILTCEQCQILGIKGDIILGSFGDGYIWSDKGGPQTAVSMHVRFIYDENVLRIVYRADGQPILASSVTPAHGTDKVSHFVCLS